MNEQSNYTIFDSPIRGWGGEWHGFESRVREAERIANGYWFNGLGVLPYRAGKHPALAEVEMLAQSDPTHAATPGNVRKLLGHLEQPNIAGHNIPFDKAQIGHLRTLILQAGDLVLNYFGAFSGGFNNALSISARQPPVRVNAVLMQQMATDLHITVSAMQQRLRDNDNIQSWLAYGLYTADLVAYATIQPLKESGIIPPQTAIVTHLQRQTDVRLIPYYDILFVGLPLAMINVYDVPPRPYLAIPHEIGHFLYRYGQVKRNMSTERIDQALQAVLPSGWQARWAEEIFADTFGCLLAGPVSVLQFQALLADGAPEHLSECDGKHPTPALRPFVQSEILRQITRRLGKKFVMVPDLLDSQWQLHLNRYVPALAGNVLEKQFDMDNQQLTGQAILDGAGVVIGKILDLFLELFGNDAQSPAHWNSWSGDVSAPSPTDVNGRAIFDNLLNSARNRLPLPNAQAEFLRAALLGLEQQFDAFYFSHRTDPQRSAFKRSELKPPPPVDDRTRPITPYQHHVKDLAQKLTNWRSGDPKIPVTEWESAFAVPEWTTEGPRGSGVNP